MQTASTLLCPSLSNIFLEIRHVPPSLFDQASKIHVKATESGSNDQELVKKGIEYLEKCEEKIIKLGLFSSNETKEDIGTTNLKYILVPFYLAELAEKILQDDRIQILKASQANLKEFISFCEAMELVPEEELQGSSQGAPNTFVDRRALKIARYKRQRAAEAKLDEIKERKERCSGSTKASAVSTPVGRKTCWMMMEKKSESILFVEAWITTISLTISPEEDCQIYSSVIIVEIIRWNSSMVQKEGAKAFSQTILDEHAKKAENWHRDAAVKARYTQPAQPITCATFAQDVLEGRAKVSQAHDHKHVPMTFGPASLVGGSLTSERERMRAQVFQPGHRLPTMSIEEARLKEMEIMNIWQE
ncbi:PP2A REGULATORY SUBUNIT TAP46 [Salix viminalis]|uniref:PP2A REGULATORY SUBUNIT TAP46 n=1 Tax=Salix viminalis TaxID=40686 RepID=A0A9Q0SCY2_SALVM|nr:PP2A REGULATORY SUBUNIT TAP46 [Salix viminalis]